MPAVSKKQQRFMGMVHAHQKGELKNPSKSVREAAESMNEQSAKDYAETPRKGLPETVKKSFCNAFLQKCAEHDLSEEDLVLVTQYAISKGEGIKSAFSEFIFSPPTGKQQERGVLSGFPAAPPPASLPSAASLSEKSAAEKDKKENDSEKPETDPRRPTLSGDVLRGLAVGSGLGLFNGITSHSSSDTPLIRYAGVPAAAGAAGALIGAAIHPARVGLYNLLNRGDKSLERQGQGVPSGFPDAPPPASLPSAASIKSAGDQSAAPGVQRFVSGLANRKKASNPLDLKNQLAIREVAQARNQVEPSEIDKLAAYALYKLASTATGSVIRGMPAVTKPAPFKKNPLTEVRMGPKPPTPRAPMSSLSSNNSIPTEKISAAKKPGLWANIHAKRKRGEPPAKPGDEDYPDSKSWEKTVKSAATPAWQRKEGKNPEGGLNEKGRRSAKAQGMNLKRPQPVGGSRRDSFCARMKGMKAKLTSSETARDPDSRINKALRKWNC